MLSGHLQRRILADVENHLQREDPELAARFALFERLARDEEPPPRECPSS